MTMIMFEYPSGINLKETVELANGTVVPRFGRRRKLANRKDGDMAPFEEDGSLYDVRDPTKPVYPINIRREPTQVVVSPTGRVDITGGRIVVYPVQAFADVGAGFGEN